MHGRLMLAYSDFTLSLRPFPHTEFYPAWDLLVLDERGRLSATITRFWVSYMKREFYPTQMYNHTWTFLYKVANGQVP